MFGLRARLLLLLGLSLSGRAVAQKSAPTVSISSGQIQGGTCASSGASYFFSIPYAKPPIGDLRYAAPVAYDSQFNGTLQATTPPASCLQFGNMFVENGTQSEDCLFLNVWAPANATANSKLPVKLWVYGGGFSAGGIANPLYSACNIAKDSIVVSVNYRLGPLGFLALKSAGLSGNYGVQDVLLGLEWVQTNIAAFGGDPKKVLLFGESAGAMMSFALSSLPNITSLVNAIAAESGAGRDLATFDQVRPTMEQYIKNLGCGLTDVACLRSKTHEELNATMYMGASTGASAGTLFNTKVFGVIIDGDVIPENPATVGVQVPAILGSNTMEGTIFIYSSYQFPPTDKDYDSFLNENFDYLAPMVKEKFPVSLFQSTILPTFFAMSAIFTQYSFTCPTHRALLRAEEKKIPAWSYIWNHTPTCSWADQIPNSQTALQFIGATHSSEIPYVFGNLVNMPQPGGSCNLTVDEGTISSQLVSAWKTMAETANASSSSLVWPAFTSTTSSGINIGNSSIVPGALDYSSCEFWNSIAESIYQNVTSGNSSTTGTTTGSPSSSSKPSAGSNEVTPKVMSTLGLVLAIASILIY